jgi:hypothetical protein
VWKCYILLCKSLRTSLTLVIKANCANKKVTWDQTGITLPKINLSSFWSFFIRSISQGEVSLRTVRMRRLWMVFQNFHCYLRKISEQRLMKIKINVEVHCTNMHSYSIKQYPSNIWHCHSLISLISQFHHFVLLPQEKLVKFNPRIE